MRRVLLLVLGASSLGTCLNAYAPSQNRFWYWSVARPAQQELRAIQRVEMHCISSLGHACASVAELLPQVGMTPNSDEQGLAESLRSQPATFPGSGHNAGPRYFFSIERASGTSFLVQARWIGLSAIGDDVWQVSETGEPTHTVASPESEVSLAERLLPVGIILGLCFAGALVIKSPVRG